MLLPVLLDFFEGKKNLKISIWRISGNSAQVKLFGISINRGNPAFERYLKAKNLLKDTPEPITFEKLSKFTRSPWAKEVDSIPRKALGKA